MDELAKVKKDGLRLLNFRPRSTEELRSRLLRKKHAASAVESALDFFTKQGFLDDEKFAKLYALSRMQSRPVGKRQIQFDLKRKGVSPRLVERALGALGDFDEKETAFALAAQRHSRMTQLPENTSKMRLYGFLKRRGFGGEAVLYALSKLYKNTEGLTQE